VSLLLLLWLLFLWIVLQKMQTEKGVFDLSEVCLVSGHFRVLDTEMDKPLIKVPPGQ
jgi:hypothetical protein